jgi:hypothetical protein
MLSWPARWWKFYVFHGFATQVGKNDAVAVCCHRRRRRRRRGPALKMPRFLKIVAELTGTLAGPRAFDDSNLAMSKNKDIAKNSSRWTNYTSLATAVLI